MSEVRPAVSDVEVDLAQLFGSLVRNWLRILVLAIAVAAGGCAAERWGGSADRRRSRASDITH